MQKREIIDISVGSKVLALNKQSVPACMDQSRRKKWLRAYRNKAERRRKRIALNRYAKGIAM